MNSSSSNNGVLESNNYNPMLNDLILKTLFNRSSPKDYGKLRLVCKSWNSNVLPVWLKTGPPIKLINAEGKDTFSKFLDEVILKQSDPADDIDGSLLGLKRYPKFELILHKKFPPDQPFEIFWAEVGIWVKSLTVDLQNIVFPEAVTVKNILTCKYTPNLESLRLKMDWIKVMSSQAGYPVLNTTKGESYMVENQLPTCWVPPTPNQTTQLKSFHLDLGEHAPQDFRYYFDWNVFFDYHPNLTHFASKSENVVNKTTVELILDAILNIRNTDVNKLALTSLQLLWKGPLPLSFCQKLRETNLKLESICISFVHEDEETIHNILSSHAGSLINLEIWRFQPLERFPFSGMDSLQSLALTDFHRKNLHFLKDLPSLRSLTLSAGAGAGPRMELGSGNIISATVLDEGTSFRSISKFFCSYYAEWTVDDIRRLAEWMPSLTTLGMIFSDANFRQVCVSLPRLEHLVVYLSDKRRYVLGDKGIVGLVKNGDGVNYTMPNITSLQTLRRIEIESYSPECSYPILSGDFTEHSITHGFLQLPRLEKLVIKVHVIRAQLKDLIEARLPFAKVTWDCLLLSDGRRLLCPKKDTFI